MVMWKGYHANKIIGLRDRHPEVDPGKVKEHYFSCLTEGISEMLRDVYSGAVTSKYMIDVLKTVKSTPMGRVRNFFFEKTVLVGDVRTKEDAARVFPRISPTIR